MNEENKVTKSKLEEALGDVAVHPKEFKEVLEAMLGMMRDLKKAVDESRKSDWKATDDRMKKMELCLEEARVDLEKLVAQVNRTTREDVKNLARQMADEMKAMKAMIPTMPDMPEPIDLRPMEVSMEEMGKMCRDMEKKMKDDLEMMRAEMAKMRTEVVAVGNKGTVIGGVRRSPSLRKYSLTDQCDGATKDFTLPIDTRDVLGVFGTQFPVQYDPSGDWTFSGRTLSLGASVGAPETGQTLWALIETL